MALTALAREASRSLQRARHVVLLGRPGADGAAATAILATALHRAGVPFQARLDDATEDVPVEDTLVLLDQGSESLDALPKAATILVLDHIQPSGAAPRHVTHLNPYAHSLDGARGCTASTLAFLLARELHAPDLWGLALAGIIAKRQHRPLSGLNAELHATAVGAGAVRESAGLASPAGWSLAEALEHGPEPYLDGLTGSPEAVTTLLQTLRLDGATPWTGLSPDDLKRVAGALALQALPRGSGAARRGLGTRWIVDRPTLFDPAALSLGIAGLLARASPGEALAASLLDPAGVPRAQEAAREYARALTASVRNARLETQGRVTLARGLPPTVLADAAYLLHAFRAPTDRLVAEADGRLEVHVSDDSGADAGFAARQAATVTGARVRGTPLHATLEARAGAVLDRLVEALA